MEGLPENSAVFQLSEWQNEQLSGVITTYTCQNTGNAECLMTYYGIDLPKSQILVEDENLRVVHVCDD